MSEGEEDDSIVVHAGFPNPATDKSLLSLDFNQLLLPHPISTFLFRIRGNDWTDQGIFDQDIAIVDRALHPKANEPVVWWDDQGRFSISSPAAMPKNSTVWGVVTGIVHQFRKPDKP